MEKKQKPQPAGPTADTYRKVTEDNSVAWTYERAVEVDAEEAGEAEEPVKLPSAPLPPGARQELVEKREEKLDKETTDK